MKQYKYKNLAAEQARHGLTEDDMAKALGCHRHTYMAKRQNGGFKLEEAFILCELFGSSVDYLFATETP